MMRDESTFKPLAPPTTHSMASLIHSDVVEPPAPPGGPEAIATKPWEATCASMFCAEVPSSLQAPLPQTRTGMGSVGPVAGA